MEMLLLIILLLSRKKFHAKQMFVLSSSMKLGPIDCFACTHVARLPAHLHFFDLIVLHLVNHYNVHVSALSVFLGRFWQIWMLFMFYYLLRSPTVYVKGKGLILYRYNNVRVHECHWVTDLEHYIIRSHHYYYRRFDVWWQFCMNFVFFSQIV